MGAPDDATFGRLSICGATWYVQILARLGDLANPEKQRLCIYFECTIKFPDGAEVLPPLVGGKGDLPVLGWWLVGTRPIVQDVPLSLCIHYPQIQGVQWGGLGTTPRFQVCPRYCLTNKWLSCLVCRSSLPTNARRRQPMTCGCGMALVSSLGLHTDFFGTRRT